MTDRIRKAAKALDEECGKLFQWPEGMTAAQDELSAAVAELTAMQIRVRRTEGYHRRAVRGQRKGLVDG